MTWQTALTLVKLVIQLLGWLQSRGYIEQGRQEERDRAAREVQAMLAKTLKIEQDISNVSDVDLDSYIQGRGWYR